MSQECSRCGLLSPDVALRCDCGYDFKSHTVEDSYLSANVPGTQVGATGIPGGHIGAHVGVGLLALAAGAFITWVGYQVTGNFSLGGLPVFIGGLAHLLRQHALRGSAPVDEDATPPAERADSGAAIAFVAPRGFLIIDAHPPGSEAMDVLAWLPTQWIDTRTISPEHVVGRLIRSRREGGRLTPDNFREHEAFVFFLHEFLARELPTRPAPHAAARKQREGWVSVIDQRVLDAPRPQPGSEPLAEDVLGAFQVRDGTIEPASYRRNQAHRLLTAKGLFQLEYALQERLKREIATRHALRCTSNTVSDRVM